MPRRVRRIAGGVIYHVLNRSVGGIRLFDASGDYAAFEKAMVETAEQASCAILTYCVMPNHWHLVLRPDTDGALSEFMRRLTVTHAQRWHAYRGTSGSGPVYQGRFKAFPVESDAHFLTVARYVERNPLRAGLVERAEAWRWSGLWRALFGTAEDTNLLAPWPIDRPATWRDWVNGAETAAELAALRQSANRGRPYGSTDWQQLMTRRLGLESAYRSVGRPRRAGAGENSGAG